MRKKQKVESTKGVVRIITPSYTEQNETDYSSGEDSYNNSVNISAIAEILTLDKRNIIVSSDLMPQYLINSINNHNVVDGTVVIITLDEDLNIKIGKDGKACVQIYKPKTYTEDEVLSMLNLLMHQVHVADEEIIYSDNFIDFKISDTNWLKKYGEKYGKSN